MKRNLLILALCLGATCSFAQKKNMIYDGPSFSPGAWNAADMRFSDNEGRHFPTLSDEIYDSHATLIFDISECSSDIKCKVMTGWWSATYRDNVNIYDEMGGKAAGQWKLPITEQMAQDCAKGHGGKDLNLMLTSGSCTINEVYTLKDEYHLTAEVANSTERLDSIVTPNSSKVVIAYDENGKRSCYTEYTWNSSYSKWENNEQYTYTYGTQNNQERVTVVRSKWDNGWINLSKNEYGYDVRGNQTSYTTYSWSEAVGNWRGDYKDESSYDAKGIQTSSVSYTWDDLAWDWKVFYKEKYEYEFSDAGEVTLSIGYTWNKDAQTWENRSKTEYAYDSNGNQTLYAYYSWQKDHWEGSNKHTRTYDNNNNETNYTYYYWDSENREWYFGWKDDYEYDNNNNQTNETYYIWDSENCEWFVGNKYDYEYDDNNNQTNVTYYYWGSENHEVSYGYKSNYEYDKNGHILSCLSQNYDIETKEWTNSVKYLYTYDEAGNQTSYAYYYWSSSSQEWIANTFYETAYDANRNQTLYAVYKWDYTNKCWVGDRKTEREFDNYSNETKIVMSSWINNNWSVTFQIARTFDTSVSGEKVLGIDTPWKQLNETTTIMNNGTLLSRRVTNYYYSASAGTGISEISTATTKAPIFDLFGQKVNHMTPGNIYLRGNAKVIVR